MTTNYNLNNSELLTQQSVKNNFGRVGSCGVLENNGYTAQIHQNNGYTAQLQQNNGYTAQLQQNNGYTAQLHQNQYEDASGYLRYPQNLGNPLIEDPKFGNHFEPIPYSPHTPHPGANSNFEPTISTPENYSNKFKEDKTNDKEQFENHERDIDKFITDKYTKEVDILNSYTEVKSTVLNMLRGVFSNKCESYKNFEDRLTESLDIGDDGTSPPVEHTSQARSHKSNDANRNHPKNNFDLPSLNDMFLRYTGKNINLENGPSSKNTIIDRMNYNDENKDFYKKQTPNSFKQHELPISGVQSEDLKIDSKTTNGPRRTSYSFKHRKTVNDLTNLISENDDKLKQALENIQKMYKQYDKSHTTNDTTVGESLDLLKNTFSKMSELSRTISNQKDNVSEYKVNSEEQLDKIEQDESEPVKSQKFPINVESSSIKLVRKSSKTSFSPKSVRSKKITNVSQQAKLNVANQRGASQLEDSTKIIDKGRSTIRLGNLSSQVGSLSLKDKSDQYGLKKFANSININNSKNIGKNVRLDIKTTTGVDEFDRSNVVRKSEYTENSRRSKKMNLKQVKNLKVENTSDNTQETTHLYPKTPVNLKPLNISEKKDNEKETRKRNVKIATADLNKLEFTKAVKSMGKTTSILSKVTTTKSMKVQNANNNSYFQGFNSSSRFHNEDAENPQAGILENMTQMRDISMKQISDKDSISVLDTNTVSPTNSSSTNIQDENNQNTGYFVFSKHAKYRRMSTPQRRERISKKDSKNASLEEPNVETI